MNSTGYSEFQQPTRARFERGEVGEFETVKAAKDEIQNPQLVAQHCFVASFGRCFAFFTLDDQLTFVAG